MNGDETQPGPNPQPPEGGWEAQITARLLGELSEADSQALDKALARDAGLVELEQRLRKTLSLVREVVADPAEPAQGTSGLPRMSPGRRDLLMAKLREKPAANLDVDVGSGSAGGVPIAAPAKTVIPVAFPDDVSAVPGTRGSWLTLAACLVGLLLAAGFLLAEPWSARTGASPTSRLARTGDFERDGQGRPTGEDLVQTAEMGSQQLSEGVVLLGQLPSGGVGRSATPQRESRSADASDRYASGASEPTLAYSPAAPESSTDAQAVVVGDSFGFVPAPADSLSVSARAAAPEPANAGANGRVPVGGRRVFFSGVAQDEGFAELSKKREGMALGDGESLESSLNQAETQYSAPGMRPETMRRYGLVPSKPSDLKSVLAGEEVRRLAESETRSLERHLAEIDSKDQLFSPPPPAPVARGGVLADQSGSVEAKSGVAGAPATQSASRGRRQSEQLSTRSREALGIATDNLARGLQGGGGGGGGGGGFGGAGGGVAGGTSNRGESLGRSAGTVRGLASEDRESLDLFGNVSQPTPSEPATVPAVPPAVALYAAPPLPGQVPGLADSTQDKARSDDVALNFRINSQPEPIELQAAPAEPASGAAIFSRTVSPRLEGLDRSTATRLADIGPAADSRQWFFNDEAPQGINGPQAATANPSDLQAGGRAYHWSEDLPELRQSTAASGSEQAAKRPSVAFREDFGTIRHEAAEVALGDSPVLGKALSTRDVDGLTTFDVALTPAQGSSTATVAGFEVETLGEAKRGTTAIGVAEKNKALQPSEVLDFDRTEVVEQLLRRKVVEEREPAAPKPAPPAAPIPQPEVATTDNGVSTFSLNVSDVSFKLAGATLDNGQLPEPGSVRTEEFLNAFRYRDPDPAQGRPVAFAWERARFPFAQQRDVLRFSVRTGASGREAGRPLNLVLLLDSSGSMERADRVSTIREALNVLGTQLMPQDRVSVVTFARTARLWLDGLPGDQASNLADRVGELIPEGGTHLEDALRVGYDTARKHFAPEGVNRLVLLTDGAANLGELRADALRQQVESNRKRGIALDCFGIGFDGYQDELLEALSRNGDGRYGFVNSPEEASTGFANQLAGALQVAASDVKVQVEFNPQRVKSWRQIGYAKHQLTREQFRDNTVDAAEIGAAESGNALYVIEPDDAGSGPLGAVRVRFRDPVTGRYSELEWAVPYEGQAVPLEEAGSTLRLATTAAAFGELLSGSPYASEVTNDRLIALMRGVPENFDPDPRPARLVQMLGQAQSILGR